MAEDLKKLPKLYNLPNFDVSKQIKYTPHYEKSVGDLIGVKSAEERGPEQTAVEIKKLLDQGYRAQTQDWSTYGTGKLRDPALKAAYEKAGIDPSKQITGFYDPNYGKLQDFYKEWGQYTDPATAHYVMGRGASEIKLQMDTWQKELNRQKRRIQEDINWIQDAAGTNPAGAEKKMADLRERAAAYNANIEQYTNAVNKVFGAGIQLEGVDIPGEYKDVSTMEGGITGAGLARQAGDTAEAQPEMKWYKSPSGNYFQVPEGSETEANYKAAGYTETPAEEVPKDDSVATKAAEGAQAGVDPRQTLLGKVEATKGTLSANKEFVNAAFKAYHGRDANAAELERFTGKSVDEVRRIVSEGAQTALAKMTGSVSGNIPADEVTGDLPDYSIAGVSGGGTSGASAGAFADNATLTVTGFMNTLSGKLTQIEAERQQLEEGKQNIFQKIWGLVKGEGSQQATLEKLQAEQEIKEKQQKYSDVLSQIETEKQKLNLGLIQEGDRLAPMSLIGRRQRKLEEQAMARIGTLTAIANVYKGDLDMANYTIEQTMTAINADRQGQLNVYDKLLDWHDNELVKLDSKEIEMIKEQKDLIKEAMDTEKENAEYIRDLLTDPDTAEAAVYGGVSITDSPEVAAMKIAPYMATLAQEKRENEWAKDAAGRMKYFTDERGNVTAFDPLTGITQNIGGVGKSTEWANDRSGTYYNISGENLSELEMLFGVGGVGGECGVWTHDISDGIPAMGDTYESKMAVTQFREVGQATPGDVLIMHAGVDTGHAAVFLDYDPATDIVTTAESNWGKDHKITIQQRKWSAISGESGFIPGTLKPKYAEGLARIASTQPSNDQLDDLLTNYPQDFKAYIKSIAGKTSIPLNSNSIGSLYQQYMDMGSPWSKEEGSDNEFLAG